MFPLEDAQSMSFILILIMLLQTAAYFIILKMSEDEKKPKVKEPVHFASWQDISTEELEALGEIIVGELEDRGYFEKKSKRSKKSKST